MVQNPSERGRTVVMVPATVRDGTATARVLARVGIDLHIAATVDSALERDLGEVGAVLMTDLALLEPGFQRFEQLLSAQPPWSDLPVVLMVREDVGTGALSLPDTMSNVTVLDRPTSTRTLVSAVQAAMRARTRQFEICDRIEALVRAEQALKEADRRKDEFLATLAHELRNPLAPICNAAHILSRMPQDAERTATLAAMITRQSGAMSLLLDDLMDVARIRNGKVVLRRSVCVVTELVASAVESARPLIESSRHQLRTQLPDPQATLYGDPLRIAQVLTNLLTNAAKYTPPGGLIELEVQSDAVQTRIQVRDSGVGISPASLPRVFELFHQVEGSLPQARGGLGIGLSLSRSLVQMHGGRIGATSQGAGCGSTFWFTVPVHGPEGVPTVLSEHEVAPPQAERQPVGADGADVDGARAQNRRVVVADDNEDAAFTLATVLQQHGWEVQVAHDGSAAIEQARSAPPAAMLLDIGMPRMNGFEVARWVRSERWGRNVLLVATTGWGQPADQQHSAQAGFDVHMTKPISPDEVLRLLAAPGPPSAPPSVPPPAATLARRN